MSRRVFITVGEVSGDAHAAGLARQLKALEPDIIIEGHGGPAMRAAGVTIHHDTVQGAAMGLRALLRVLEVRRLLKWTADYYRRSPPDLHVCIDSWSMNWLFARLARRAGRPVLYYIAPQAWASRPGRVKRLRRHINRLACILPFEEDWFSSRGVPTTFVGHPLFDHLPAAPPQRQIDLSRPVIGLLPGSRRAIAGNNFPSLLDAAIQIRREIPAVTFLIPSTQNTEAVIRAELSRRGLSDGFTVAPNAFDEIVPRCDLCLTVSGTATLHVAAHNVPMIVVYRANWLLWQLLGRWIINARTFALVNILSGSDRHIVPEIIPWHGSAKPVADLALDYLRNPAKLAEQRRALSDMIRPLAVPGASKKVAQLALDLMKAPPNALSADIIGR
jgi:lipid-A-disaccharide synthase